MNIRKIAYSLAVVMLSYDVISKNAPVFTFKIRNRVSRRETILALFTVVPKVAPVYGSIVFSAILTPIFYLFLAFHHHHFFR